MPSAVPAFRATLVTLAGSPGYMASAVSPCLVTQLKGFTGSHEVRNHAQRRSM